MLLVAIVGKGIYRYSATGSEEPYHLQVTRIHQRHEILHYYIDAILMKVAVVAETEQIELQALALDHLFARNVVDDYARKVGLTGLGAQ